MIHKNDLKGKYVTYWDNSSKQRIGKVSKVSGSHITVKDALGSRRRIHKDRVLGRQYPKKGLEQIDWSIRKVKHG